jgi:hypothetical protein
MFVGRAPEIGMDDQFSHTENLNWKCEHCGSTDPDHGRCIFEDLVPSQDETSEAQHEDPAVPSEDFTGAPTVYTGPDGAMWVTGKLHLKVLDAFGTEQNCIIGVLIAPAYAKSFNQWSTEMENTVFLEAHIVTPRL